MKSTVSTKLKVMLPLFFTVAAVSPRVFAQVNSSTSAISLSATLPASIGISTSAATFTWSALTPGATTAAGAPITITTSWALGGSAASVELDAFFASASQAMTDGSSNYIPAANIYGTVGGDDTVASTPISANTTLGTAGAGLTIFSRTIASDFAATRSNTLALSIHLGGLTIPAGTYTGTLTLQAQSL